MPIISSPTQLFFPGSLCMLHCTVLKKHLWNIIFWARIFASHVGRGVSLMELVIKYFVTLEWNRNEHET